jgi:putative GTP pyrophosphokinase
MADKPKLTPELYREQIEKYRLEYQAYEVYARTLDRVFRNACKVSFPDSLVQSRPKNLSSFAEKMARKFEKYPDAVKQMTDLCGARVIVQTTEQVKAVRQFIEANFEIVEHDDKVLLLGEDEFGYRDMHYIVMLRDDRNDTLGINASEAATIGKRRAEVQVRTWVQHAWADTLHDRIYKNKLTISSDIKRSGSLLAAILEEADHSFDFLADELDGLIANYTAVSTVKAAGDRGPGACSE